ncbi:MAG: hypothetical protein IT324_31510 [Anaerolineae bacterium]|nr:hypothetical protein [Anaerolineae bacterium]
MARRSAVPDESVRINFRLNPRRPKERVILEFLRQHADNYDASRVIKQALYELATGRDWLTNEPLRIREPLPEDRQQPSLPAPETDYLLDEILSGLDEWSQQ